MATWTYLPILKWKQGERIALRNLKSDQWSGIVPLIELMPIVSAPDTPALRKALPPYLTAIAKELEASFPEDGVLAVDVRHVSTEFPRKVVLLEAVCRRLQELSDRRIIPVLNDTVVVLEGETLDRLADKFDDVIVRFDVSSSGPSEIRPIVKIVKTALKPTMVHIVVDQVSLVGNDVKAAAARVKPYLDEALKSGGASVTLAGGSFPINLMGMKQGTRDIERVEWKIWTQLVKTADYQRVRFSDYTVTNPVMPAGIDPKKMNPSVAIRYAADGFWRLFKAGGFKKSGKKNQYQALCQLLMGDDIYTGADYSFGDKCYEGAATARLGNGNPSSWRRDATSHHLVLTGRALTPRK